MYEVAAVDLDGPVRAGDPFNPRATVVCEGGDCMDSDVVMAIDGQVVATDGVRLPDGNEFTLRPPGEPIGPRLTSATWVDVGDDGSVVVRDPGMHTLSITVGDQHREIEFEVGPPRGRVDSGQEALE